MEDKRYYYIAYGSNLNLVQMGGRCPYSVPVGTVTLHDYQLAFKGSLTGSYLTLDKVRGAQTPGVVWSVTKSDIENLNRYEGYPTFYYIKRFKSVDIKLFTGEETKLGCFLYLMNKGRSYGLPSGSYIRTCLEGFFRFGIDDKYLDEALQYTKLKMQCN